MTYKHFNVSVLDGVSMLCLAAGRYTDRDQIQATQRELIGYIDSEKPSRLVIDFQDVAAISSEFITTMLRCSEYIKADSGQLCFCNMSPIVRMAFKVTNLDGTLLVIHDTMPKAVQSFK